MAQNEYKRDDNLQKKTLHNIMSTSKMVNIGFILDSAVGANIRLVLHSIDTNALYVCIIVLMFRPLRDVPGRPVGNWVSETRTKVGQ